MGNNELAKETSLNLRNLQNQVTEAALEVQKNIGPGFSPKDYCQALAYEFQLRDIPFERGKNVKLPYKGNVAGQYKLDFVVKEKMIITVLSEDEISDSDRSKMRNFLKALNLGLGMVINFSKEKVEIKAVYN